MTNANRSPEYAALVAAYESATAALKAYTASTPLDDRDPAEWRALSNAQSRAITARNAHPECDAEIAAKAARVNAAYVYRPDCELPAAAVAERPVLANVPALDSLDDG